MAETPSMLSPSVGLLHGYREPVYVKVLYSPLTCLRLRKGTRHLENLLKVGKNWEFCGFCHKNILLSKNTQKKHKNQFKCFYKISSIVKPDVMQKHYYEYLK